MKHGAEYAKRIKRLYGQLRRQYGTPPAPEPTEPLEQLVLGILSRGTSDAKAHSAYSRLQADLVDYNELRVTPWVEVADTIRPDLPDAEARARDLIDALNAIYDRHNSVDLAFLRQKSVREAREYLRSLPGVDEYTAARIVLLSLGGHAVPVDDSTVDLFRREDLISPEATVAEVQSFLERHVASSEAAQFMTLMRRYTAARAPRSASTDGARRSDKASATQRTGARERKNPSSGRQRKPAKAAATRSHRTSRSRAGARKRSR